MEIKRLTVTFGAWDTATTFSSVVYRRFRPFGIWTPLCMRFEKISTTGSTSQRKKMFTIINTGWFGE